MDTFDAAIDRVTQALTTGKIGQPVAVRIVAHLAVDHGWLERLAQAALVQASEWIGSPWASVSAVGGIQRGELTALLRFVSGATALVSVGSCGAGTPILETVITGSHGILSSEATDAQFIEINAPPKARNTPEAHTLLKAVVAASERGSVIEADGTQRTAEKVPRQVRLLHRSAKSVRLKPQAPPYGILLVAGHHTHQPMYAPALAADPRCRLIGLADEADVPQRRQALNARYAAELKIPLLDNLDNALPRDDVDIVSICAEPARRGGVIIKAAEAGKHVYLDKPLAGSSDDAAAIVQAVQQAGVVSHMFSFVRSPLAAKLKAILDSGRLGTLVAAHFDLTFAKGTNGTARLGQPRKENPAPEVFELPDSKRELTNIGVYPLAMLTWLTGKEAMSVFASTGNYFFTEHQQNDMEDFGQVLIEMNDGLTASVSVGRTGWTSHPSAGLNRTYLVGTKSTAVVDLYRPRVEIWSGEANWGPPKVNPEDPMGMWVTPPESPFAAAAKQAWTVETSDVTKADAAYFLDCIEQGRTSELSAVEAAQTTQILAAAYQSAASGRVVRFDS